MIVISKTYRRTSLVLGVVFSLSLIFAAGQYTRPAQAADDNSCQTFSETGHQVCGRFLEYWKANGGLAQQGYPISDVFEEQNAAPPAGDGKVHQVQYFQRARFEAHPENAAPYDVLLGLLGTEQFHAKYAQVPAPPKQTGTCQYFKETDLEVCGRFLEYWKANGGLAQQGFPISGVIEEQNAPPPAGDGKVHQVQYFQRARFEAHPENAAPYDVLLGLLGAEQYNAKYGSLPPAPTPTPTPGATPTPAPTTTTPTPAPTTPPATATPVSGSGSCLPLAAGDGAQACVTNPTPLQNSNETVYGRLIVNGQPAVGAVMNTIWEYKSKKSTCDTGITDDTGVTSCTLGIGGATKGFPVKIEVEFSYNGEDYNTSTSFTPQ